MNTNAERTKMERHQILLDPDLLRKVEDWRRKQPDLPNKSQAIRRLVERALGADELTERES